ncbi:MAG TPA: glycosyltransferase 87 family protein [Ktedonobacteraceae bacterium]|nr:glycosyltransferase 87 family protein [Ktedonobacteraceae bacterium]
MNNDSTTVLADDVLAGEAHARHPVFLFVRPALVVGCLYLLFIGLDMLIHEHTLLYYVHIGPRFVLHMPKAAPGYDGQFYYQIARDPFHVSQFLDHPAYRYQRIVYSIVVAILSLGQANFIPFMLLLVNFLAIILGTELIARMLVQQKLSPWFSLAFGLYFGQATAFIFDTTEPFTYFLVCLGLFLMLRKRPTVAALIMGVAVLSRETAILFPMGYLLVYLYQKRWRDALRLFLLSIAPTVIWYAIIALLFKTSGVTTAPAFQLIPFKGLFYFANDAFRFRNLLILMLIPTLLSLFLLVKEVLQHRWLNAPWLMWLFNLCLVICMSPLSYVELVSAGRLSTGLVLAMLFYGCVTKNKTILWACQIYGLTFLYYTIGILAFRLH